MKTILTVDDSRTMRDMLRAALAGAGFDVVQAEDGVHGLEVLAGCDPDVIVTDVNMPRMDGLTFIEQLRANADAFALFSQLIRRHWQQHNTLVGFAMDHGCHEIDGDLGSHGLDMPEDLNIRHRYMAYPAK